MSEFWIGTDVGLTTDATAIVVVEALWLHTRHEYPNGRFREDVEDAYQVTQIDRYVATPFVEVVDELCRLDAAYRPMWSHMDMTGVGAGLEQMLYVAYSQGRIRRRVSGVHFTAPVKLNVLSALDRLVQEHRLLVPTGLPHADKLRQELDDYRRGYTARGNVTMGSATAAAHDDLVVATALAVYPTAFRRKPVGAGHGVDNPARFARRTITHEEEIA